MSLTFNHGVLGKLAALASCAALLSGCSGITGSTADSGAASSGGTAAADTVAFTASNFSVSQNDGTATITVARSGPLDAAVSVAYSTTNGSATAEPVVWCATSPTTPTGPTWPKVWAGLVPMRSSSPSMGWRNGNGLPRCRSWSRHWGPKFSCPAESGRPNRARASPHAPRHPASLRGPR